MKSENSRKDEQTQYLNAGLYNFNETVIKRMKHQSGTCFFMYVRIVQFSGCCSKRRWSHQRTLTIGGRIIVWLVTSLTDLDLTKNGKFLLFVCIETV